KLCGRVETLRSQERAVETLAPPGLLHRGVLNLLDFLRRQQDTGIEAVLRRLWCLRLSRQDAGKSKQCDESAEADAGCALHLPLVPGGFWQKLLPTSAYAAVVADETVSAASSDLSDRRLLAGKVRANSPPIRSPGCGSPILLVESTSVIVPSRLKLLSASAGPRRNCEN